MSPRPPKNPRRAPLQAAIRAIYFGVPQPTFEERSLQSYRAYYEYLPKGTWMVEYTIRLNQEGRFNLPPSRVEAMYSPDIFGEIPMGPVNVRRGR